MNEMLNWAGCGGSSKLNTGYNILDQDPYRLSPNKGQYKTDWPCLSKSEHIKSEGRDTEVIQKDRSKCRRFTGETFPNQRPPTPVPTTSSGPYKLHRHRDSTGVHRYMDTTGAHRSTTRSPSREPPLVRYGGQTSDIQHHVDFLPNYIQHRNHRGFDSTIPTIQGSGEVTRGRIKNRDYIPQKLYDRRAYIPDDYICILKVYEDQFLYVRKESWEGKCGCIYILDGVPVQLQPCRIASLLWYKHSFLSSR